MMSEDYRATPIYAKGGGNQHPPHDPDPVELPEAPPTPNPEEIRL